MLNFKLNSSSINSDILTTYNFISSLLLLFITISLYTIFFTKKNPSRRVFLVDFSCYKPPESQKCTREAVLERAKKHGVSADSLSFMEKTMRTSSIGDSTYIPENIMSVPPNLSFEAARKESETVMFGAIDSLLAKTKVRCSEIGILIVHCTVFNPVPSLASVIVNHYKLRGDICCYNLSGMGCSASLIVSGLAKKLLQVHENTYALVVNTENLTRSVYTGADPSKLLINGLFRLGGTAALFSNKPSHRRHSNYELLHAVNTNTASSNLAYKCIYQEEDSDGNVGITITKDLLVAATAAVEQHLKKLGFLILPPSEQLLYAINHIIRRLKIRKNMDPYVPKFNGCAKHFLPHVGTRQVQDAVQRKLGFCAGDMEASRMTLHRFGNVSSSSIWYELAYVEAKRRVKKGDRVWQIAYGSGFKCSSLIMRALRDVEVDEMNPWMSDIDEYPVDLDTSPSFSYFVPPNMQ